MAAAIPGEKSGHANLLNGVISPPNSEASDPRLVRFFRDYAILAGFLVTAIGIVVLIGWLAHIPALVQVSPGWVTVKANTAVGLVVAGVAVSLAAAERRAAFPFVRACGIFLTALGAATLAEYIFGWDLGIDRLI